MFIAYTGLSTLNAKKYPPTKHITPKKRESFLILGSFSPTFLLCNKEIVYALIISKLSHKNKIIFKTKNKLTV